MKIGIIAAIDLINNQPIGGIIGFLENIIPFLKGEIYLFGYTRDKKSVGQIVKYKNIKLVNLFFYDFEKSKIPLRIVGLIKYLINSKNILKYSLDIIYFHSPEFLLSFYFHSNKKCKFILHLHGAGLRQSYQDSILLEI